jgi:hypothetical protein
MPTIRNLYRLRQGLCCGFAIPSATIAGDDRDRRMRSESRLGEHGGAVEPHLFTGGDLSLRQASFDSIPNELYNINRRN